MSNDKMRAEFEEWLSKQVDIYGLPYLAAMHKDLEYISGRTQLFWQVWQASRAAQVVELPDFFVCGIDAALYRDDVIDALDVAGVAYK